MAVLNLQIIVLEYALEAINKRIRKIYRKNKLKNIVGDEAFWNAVEDLEKTNKGDGVELRKLGNQWDEVFKELQTQYKNR
jgi:hypothetical protein